MPSESWRNARQLDDNRQVLQENTSAIPLRRVISSCGGATTSFQNWTKFSKQR
jgi:hypothetical protein